MREILLSNGMTTMVDDADYEMLSAWKWQVQRSWNSLHVCRSEKRDGRKRCIFMHRVILGAPDGIEVDHANGNGLDNRRENLRLATKRENARNRRQLRAKKTSRYHGVCYRHPWRAVICAGDVDEQGRSKQIYLGHFATEEEAARAYDRAAIAHFGAFATTNFPREDYP